MVAVALLDLVTVGLAGAVAAGLGAIGPPEPPPQVALELSVDAGTDRIAIAHLGGDPLDVRTVGLRVAVDGRPLEHQPPVPFFAAPGFRSGPEGPFNSASDPTWAPGETASLRVAGTNAPALAVGARVQVEVYASDQRIARLTATAG